MNYLELIKNFLKYKFNSLDKSKWKNNINIIELEENLLKQDNINDIHKACNLIASSGLKQITTVSNALKNYYIYCETEKLDIGNTTTESLKKYVNITCKDMKLKKGTRSNYKNTLTSFFTYLDNEHLANKKFNIKAFEVSEDVLLDSNCNVNDLITSDWLDKKQLEFVNKHILTNYKKDDDSFEKFRDILIFRIFCFSGITPSEMSNLELKDFVFENGDMTLNIRGTGSKKRSIPLPEKKLIVYFNKYTDKRDIKANKFFYSLSNSIKSIDEKYLNKIVKFFLEKSNIDLGEKYMTPTMLRKTFLILVNNEKDPTTGLTQTEKNVQYLSGLSNTTQLREILKYHHIDYTTVSKVFDDLDI